MDNATRVLAALKQARTQLEQADAARREPIALVGTACRLPGGVDTPEKFWDLLLRGQDAITAMPADRWDHSRYYAADPDASGKTNVSGGGFIPLLREFDAEFFGIAPREAMSLDPQQRQLLEVAWEALEDAGTPPARLFGKDVGVFASVYWGDYGTRLLTRRPEEFDAYTASGVATNMAAGRLAHILGLQGPALVVDTACSSSLVALHLACQSLRNRECETALVGAASQILSPELYVNFTRARMLSPDNRCKTFDATANGFVRSEGCVVVVLKRLSDAVKSGDNVLAVILGSAVNHDGHSSGLTVPNGPAQQAVIRRALHNGGIEPAEVGYVEAHGTGTPLGDPIEVGALGAVFARAHSSAQPLMLGSVKSNIGHLEATAGLAGLLKAALCVRHGQVPPNLHFTDPNPHIPWRELPFVVPTQPRTWQAQTRRVAGVSSFGFSGTNAHVVLAQAPEAVEPAVARTLPVAGPYLLTLSARSTTSLRALIARYVAFIRARTDLDIADICFSANTGRTHFLHRVAVLGGSAAELLSALEAPNLTPVRVDRGPKASQTVSDPSAARALYLEGAELDWTGLYPAGVRRRRVSLPHYAFERKLYWIEGTPAPSSARASGHPLLGEGLSPATGGSIYEASLSAAGSSWLTDHRIDGQLLMPATGFVEMAIAAGRLRPGSGPVCIEDLVLQAPLVLPETEARMVQLLLEPGAEGVATFRVMAASGEEWLQCASGKLTGRESNYGVAAFDIAAFQARASLVIDGTEHYARLAERKLAFGPAFCGVQRIWSAGDAALGEIKRPAGLDTRGFACHPALLDACLQVVAALAPDAAGVWVPMSIDRVTLPAQAPDRLFTHVRLTGRGDSTGIRADVAVLDEVGRPVAEIAGLTLRSMSNPARIPAHLYGIAWRSIPRGAPAPQAAPGQWIVFGDRGGRAVALSEALSSRGVRCKLWGPDEVDLYDAVAIRSRLQDLGTEPIRGVVHFGAVDADFTAASSADELRAAQHVGCGTVLALAQALASLETAFTGRLWLVTEGAQSVANIPLSARGLAQAAVLGLGRVFTRELPALKCGRVDLDPRATVSANAAALATELFDEHFEDEVALRNGEERHVPRLQPLADRIEDTPTRLVNTTPGILDGLRLVPFEPRDLKPQEVEIRVKATGLGFRDVLGALGMYPGEPQPLGCECAGIVTAVGAEVTGFRVGEAVFGLVSDCFGSVARAHHDLLAHKPATLSFAAAATIPSSFLTAYYTLEVLGKLQAGQRVLIHAAAGGVGQAAVQIASAAGAEVFATAGSDSKRQWLRDQGVRHVFDSRSPAFAAEIRRITRGRGVDFVLNSLADPLLSASFDVLADEGCFLEIGKRGILETAEATRRKPRARYFIVDLGEVAQREPATVHAMLATLVERLEAGRIPTPRFEEFPLSSVTDAFRHMAQAKHLGKIVVRNDAATEGLEIADGATYLITGGLGGLGPTVAAHLVDRGARHLALLGRKPASEAVLQQIAELEKAGVTVKVLQGDVSRSAELARVLSEIRRTGPPLKGIIHAAGVLDDGVVAQQSWDRFEPVLAPKVLGAWNLHTLTAQDSLDWLVLFGSAAAVFGLPGQANYAAANAFLDSFAAWRRANGLPAQTIDWGPWGEVGMAARAGHARGSIAQRAGAFAPEAGLAALERACAHNVAQVVVLPPDWKQFAERSLQGAALPLVQEVWSRPTASPRVERGRGGSSDSNIVAELENAPAALREKVLLRFVIEQVRKVLGLAADEPIDPQQPLQELGLDSLMAVELRNSIAAETGRSLPATFAFDYPVPAAVAAQLCRLLSPSQAGPAANGAEPFSRPFAHAPPPPAPALAPAPDQATPPPPQNEPIAIVGMGCRLPGGIDSPEGFWEMLQAGGQPIGPVPADRWDAEALYDSDPDAPGKTYCKVGAFIDGVAEFDPYFFGIPPREAQSMDPQQRLLLEVAWQTLEQAGADPSRLRGSRTGVFVGVGSFDYGLLEARALAAGGIDAYFGSGIAHSVAAGRLSYFFGFEGPSLAIDTACSSSLVAVHQACMSLRAGECRMALAGGANLMLAPDQTLTFSRARMLSASGRCNTFDARADGYVRGEGVALVALKRLSDAIADGDRVHAIIRGSAVNQDGRSTGLTVPNGPAQTAVITQAIRAAGVKPAEVRYVEAHGTGTPLGDPIEVQALAAALGVERRFEDPLLIGSVKTNIGHLESSAGIAGLLKVVLALREGAIPAHLGFERPNPHIDWASLPVAVTAQQRTWPEGPRIAGVSSFGFSGTNAHVVLEQAPAPVAIATNAGPDRPTHLLMLSAKTEVALQQLVARYRAHLARGAAEPLADICYTAGAGRAHFPHRLALVGRTHAEFADGLARAVVSPPARATPEIAFLFTGQGSQYPGMGRELYDAEPVFRDVVDCCATALGGRLEHDLREVMFSVGATELHQTRYTQPALYAFEVGMAQLWKSWGIEPAVVLGHSVGEYAAACVAGVFEIEDGARLIAERGRRMQVLPGAGAMLAVQGEADELMHELERASVGSQERVCIAAHNAPGNVVLSGDVAELDRLGSQLQARGLLVQRLQVSHGFHSPQMQPMLADFERCAATVPHRQPRVAWVSNLTGEALQWAQWSARMPEYWRRHVREPVQFERGVRSTAKLGVSLFIELGPHPVLSGLGRATLKDPKLAWLASSRRGAGAWEVLMQSVAEAYVRGGCVDWKGFDRAQSRQVVALPTYPFERQKYWIEAPIERARPTWEEAVAAGSLQAQYAPLDLALETFPTKWAVLERLSRAYMVETLRSFGLFTKHGETLTVHQVVGTAGIQLIYTKLIERWLERLVDAKLLQRADAGFVATQPLTGEPVETVREEARLAFSDYPGLFEYVTLCGRELQSVLTGRQSALETLFPGGSTHLADEIYRTSGIAKYFNAIVRALVQSIARGASSLSILEIGAGTGSTTSLLLPELSAAGPRYSFTDVSQLFLARARARFAQYAFIDYGILDIEKSPAAQGYTEGAYDIVVAVNVLHATGDLEATLRNARALLASNGVLIMLETTAHPIWLEITTGLIEGWQKFADPLRASHPLLDRREWSTLLAGCGFTAVEAFPPEGAPTGLLGQHVIIARAPTRAGAPVPVAKFVRAPAGAELDGMVTAQSHESVDTLRARLETASIEGREDLLIELVCQEIGDVLGADARHRPQADERLHDFGVDSLMAVELRNRLVRRLALEQKLTATLIFDYPTPLAIARHLADLVFGSAGSHAVAEAAPSSEVPRIDRAALESMGDDEAEALLASRLEQL